METDLAESATTDVAIDAEAAPAPHRGGTLSLVAMALAALLFLAVSATYSVLVPMYEAPDERMHVRYVEKLAYDHELPEPAETHLSLHPPLYYTIGAVTLAVFGLPEPPARPISPTFPTTTSAHIHYGEGFPYHNGVLSLHVLRAISILFGLGIVLLTYLLAEVLFPGRRLLAFSAAATAGLVPQFAFIGAMVNNDVPAAFFATGVIYCGVRLLNGGGPRWLVASSLLLGLGMLTKAPVAISGIVPLVAVAVSAQNWQGKARDVAFLALVPLALAGWYYIRSIILWGDVFTTVDKVGGLPFRIGDARGLGDPIYRNDFLGAVVKTYWYKGGYLNVGFTRSA